MDAIEQMINEEETRKPKRDNDRIFERPISINRKFIAKIHIRNQPGDDLQVRDRLAHLQNFYGMNIQDLANLIFVRGLDLMEREAYSDEISDFDKAVLEAYVHNTDRKLQFAKFEVLYREMAPEDFKHLCKNQPFYYEFMEAQSHRQDIIKLTEQRIIWLRNFLHESGRNGEAKIDVIRYAAEAEGIIRDESDWDALKTLASRCKLSAGGEHGAWKWNPRAEIKFRKVEVDAD